MNIQGKVALVTGASRGIGRAIAQELALNGARRIILIARNPHRLNQVAAEIRYVGVEVIAIPIDLTTEAVVSANIAKAWRDYGDIDLLVNCAGVAHQAPFLRSRVSAVEQEMATNMMGMYHVTSLIARRMVSRRKGTIVNVSSLMGKIAAPTMATYSATKFAIVGFTKALRLELAPHNVNVMALLPSLTDTDMVKGLQRFRGVIPMTSQQVAKACIKGINKGSSEVLVGWQSHLAALCDRISPQLLAHILKLTAPSILLTDRPLKSGHRNLPNPLP